MTLPELHPEIWSHVISFLIREPPPAHESRPWSDLHQHDLTTVARVNSLFQELVAPHLYAQVTTEDFSMFIRGAADSQINLPTAQTTTPDSSEASLSSSSSPAPHSRVMQKMALLKYTKELRIPHSGPNCCPLISLKKILAKGVSEWAHIGESESERSARITEQAEQIFTNHTVALWGVDTLSFSGNAAPILHNLNKVILGRKDSCSWLHVQEANGGDPNFTMRLDLLRGCFTKLILACRPSDICSHSQYGPYHLHPGSLPKDLTNLTVTTHIYRNFDFQLPWIFVGAVNKIIAEPGTNFVRMQDMLAVGFDFAGLTRDLTRSLKVTFEVAKQNYHRQRIKRTRVTIYRLARQAPSCGSLPERDILTNLMPGLGDMTEDETKAAWSKCQVMEMNLIRKYELNLLQTLTETLVPGLPRVWRNRVVFESMEHPRASCEICDTSEVKENEYVP